VHGPTDQSTHVQREADGDDRRHACADQPRGGDLCAEVIDGDASRVARLLLSRQPWRDESALFLEARDLVIQLRDERIGGSIGEQRDC